MSYSDKDEKNDKKGEKDPSYIVKKVEKAESYWSEIYQQAATDRRFVTEDDGQWSDEERRERKEAGRVTLQVNKLRTYAKQIINQARQGRQQISVEPVDNKADVATAKVLRGIIKDVEVSSNADAAYDAALESIVYGAVGFIRVHCDFVGDESFEQEPKIMAIYNAESCYIDPASKEYDGSDARWAVVSSWEDKDAIVEQYGADAAQNFEGFEDQSNWVDEKDCRIRVAELFELEDEQATLYRLTDGTVTFDKPEDQALIVDQRQSKKRVCKWCKATGSKVLERREFIVPMIPIVPVYGDVTWDGEKRHVFSLIHWAKDPQRLYNLWRSTEAVLVSDSVSKQFMADVRAAAGREEWQDPEKYQTLFYNGKDEMGDEIAPPQVIDRLSPLASVLNASEGAKRDIEEILNMQPAAMGQNINNQSGRAIGLLQSRADTAHFHIVDNLSKSIAQVGRIVMAIIQEVTTEAQVRRITGDDGKTQLVNVNQPVTPEMLAEMQQKDQELSGVIDNVLNNITVGRYDIRISTGASYLTQRQEMQESLTSLLQYVPQIGQVAPDLLLKVFDNGNNMLDDIVARLAPQTDGQDPRVAQLVQEFDAQMQQLTAQLQQAQAQANDKQAELDAEYAIEQLKADTTLRVAEMSNYSKAEIEELKGAIELLKLQQTPPPEWSGIDIPDPNQMQNEPPENGGFLMPEQMQEQAQAPVFAPDVSQIEEQAPMTAQDPELGGNQG